MVGGALGGTRGERPVAIGARDVGRSAAHEVVVDHVVVHDQGGVQQLECRTHVGGGLEVGAAESVVGAHHHARAEPLAADGVVLEGLPELDILRTEGCCAVLG